MIRFFGISTIMLLGLFSHPVIAQQWVVDDSGVAIPRSMQLEAWHGEQESWIQPAVSMGEWMEFSAGAGFLNLGNQLRQSVYNLEAKFSTENVVSGPLSVALSAGYFFSPKSSLMDAWYLNVPVGFEVIADRLIFYTNTGITFEDGESVVNAGIRGDIWITRRTNIVTELFTDNDGSPIVLHSGICVSLLEDVLKLDLSYGFAIDSSEVPLGLTFGIVITPSAFY